jgi:hypothetical protein
MAPLQYDLARAPHTHIPCILVHAYTAVLSGVVEGSRNSDALELSGSPAVIAV